MIYLCVVAFIFVFLFFPSVVLSVFLFFHAEYVIRDVTVVHTCSLPILPACIRTSTGGSQGEGGIRDTPVVLSPRR